MIRIITQIEVIDRKTSKRHLKPLKIHHFLNGDSIEDFRKDKYVKYSELFGENIEVLLKYEVHEQPQDSHIIVHIAKYFGVKPSDIMKPTRKGEVVAARHFYQYFLLQKFPKYRLTMLHKAKGFKGWDHANLIATKRKIDARREIYPDIDEQYGKLMAKLNEIYENQDIYNLLTF